MKPGPIGKTLSALRRERGLSQGKLEALTGLACAYISRVENGHTEPGLKTLERWARALGTPLSEIIRRWEAQSRQKAPA